MRGIRINLASPSAHRPPRRVGLGSRVGFACGFAAISRFVGPEGVGPSVSCTPCTRVAATLWPVFACLSELRRAKPVARKGEFSLLC